MANFCLDCWNDINETNTQEKMYILSRDFDLCEDCGQQKHIIVRVRMRYIIKDILQNWLFRKQS